MGAQEVPAERINEFANFSPLNQMAIFPFQEFMIFSLADITSVNSPSSCAIMRH